MAIFAFGKLTVNQSAVQKTGVPEFEPLFGMQRYFFSSQGLFNNIAVLFFDIPVQLHRHQSLKT
jgi:hypothetical protein